MNADKNNRQATSLLLASMTLGVDLTITSEQYYIIHSLFSVIFFFLVKIVYIVQESCLNDCKLVKNTGWWNKLITYGISMTTSVVFVPIYAGCPNLKGFQDPSRWAIARDTKSSDISWFTISFSTMLLIIQYRAELIVIKPMATELVYNGKFLRP